ncbi:PKD domain-containing protein [Hymenobacter sp. M29]|uniref:PKD domain-containing protein n=1 Tax=Hymenobacter mellowenesis TaxID=3063995 RepID=A0ABT9A798_9BACT|nr:PKD domain-containing protein [Hymenobacter sp. M29]MDO7845267.1 PKD domain-containing protein [Hymenobacter sp. M29]
MKNLRNNVALLLLGGALLLAACDKKDTGTLGDPVPAGTFTTTSRTVGLTTEVTFTAAPNPDVFLYHWEFGDGTGTNGTGSVATGQTVTHVYSKGGTFKAQLITDGRGGQTFSAPKDVVIPSSLNIVKQLLTNGSSRTWKLDNTVVAPITVGPSDADPVSYYGGNPAPGGLPACQADDEYTFSNANVFTYDAKGQTFVAGATGGCQAPRNVTTPFTFGDATGAGVAQITLASATPAPFIGVTDAPGFTYRILSITNTNMVLRAGSTAAGVVFDMKLVVK